MLPFIRVFFDVNPQLMSYLLSITFSNRPASMTVFAVTYKRRITLVAIAKRVFGCYEICTWPGRATTGTGFRPHDPWHSAAFAKSKIAHQPINGHFSIDGSFLDPSDSGERADFALCDLGLAVDLRLCRSRLGFRLALLLCFYTSPPSARDY